MVAMRTVTRNVVIITVTAALTVGALVPAALAEDVVNPLEDPNPYCVWLNSEEICLIEGL